jgi:hypothetical protein
VKHGSRDPWLVGLEVLRSEIRKRVRGRSGAVRDAQSEGIEMASPRDTWFPGRDLTREGRNENQQEGGAESWRGADRNCCRSALTLRFFFDVFSRRRRVSISRNGSRRHGLGSRAGMLPMASHLALQPSRTAPVSCPSHVVRGWRTTPRARKDSSMGAGARARGLPRQLVLVLLTVRVARQDANPAVGTEYGGSCRCARPLDRQDRARMRA